LPVNVGDASSIEEAAATVLKKHGRIDLLVNSAGLNVTSRSWTDLTT
jgi:NAD(P)-dependent dehydrogenase (short-subunit alcohol dehydrogenase family)